MKSLINKVYLEIFTLVEDRAKYRCAKGGSFKINLSDVMYFVLNFC